MLKPWLLLGVLATLGCGGDPATGRSGRVLLIGLDGATLRVAEPLLAEGLLPNLARIAQDGVHGPLQSFRPLMSPRIWATIATGKVPEKHGILAFSHPRGDGSTALYRSSDRKTTALWNITSDAGLTTAVVNWWTTFPAERIDGVMVTDHFFPGEVAKRRRFFGTAEEPTAPTVHPASWQERALAAMRDPRALPAFENPLAVSARSFRGSDATDVFERDNAVARIALAVERELHPGVLMVFFPGIDRVSHVLWGMLEPSERRVEQPTPEERVAGQASLRGYYVHADRLVGLLLDRYGPQDLVVVVSDHGFEASDPASGEAWTQLTGGHESEAASRGILFARGPGIEPGANVEGLTVNDVTPTILTWLGLPLGSDMDGRPAAFLQREPPSLIATYDTKPVDRLEAGSSGAERERLDELRALGYIE